MISDIERLKFAYKYYRTLVWLYGEKNLLTFRSYSVMIKLHRKIKSESSEITKTLEINKAS